jgi:hypothetical protein
MENFLMDEHVAGVLLSAAPEEVRDTVSTSVVQLGNKKAVDLRRLNEPVRSTFYSYMQADRLLGQNGGRGGIRSVRDVSNAQYSEREGKRTYLKEHVEALSSVTCIGESLYCMLETNLNESQLETFVNAELIEVTETGADRWTVKGSCTASHFSCLFGGLPDWREVSRTFKLDVSRAKWRDRPSRRLISCSVSVTEVFADPRSFWT